MIGGAWTEAAGVVKPNTAAMAARTKAPTTTKGNAFRGDNRRRAGIIPCEPALRYGECVSINEDGKLHSYRMASVACV
jgi:hypothetical protein